MIMRWVLFRAKYGACLLVCYWSIVLESCTCGTVSCLYLGRSVPCLNIICFCKIVHKIFFTMEATLVIRLESIVLLFILILSGKVANTILYSVTDDFSPVNCSYTLRKKNEVVVSYG